ncbi:hypothetical protein MAXJ12_10408, partial [Mesorhizobium alhagi CCNWXJ12-2]
PAAAEAAAPAARVLDILALPTASPAHGAFLINSNRPRRECRQ